MRKIFFLIAVFLIFCTQAFADVFPVYTNSISHWGAGLAKIGERTVIYEAQSMASPIAEVLVWDEKGSIVHKNSGPINPQNTFVAFVPSEKLAFLSVDDEEDGWIRVCYNQKNLKFGWIKKSDENEMLLWQDFFSIYGKKYGIYLFRDVKKENKKLFSKPEDDAQVIDRFEYVKNITPWLVKGNWMLVKIINYDNTKKTGWMKWRDSLGQLYVFAYFK